MGVFLDNFTMRQPIKDIGHRDTVFKRFGRGMVRDAEAACLDFGSYFVYSHRSENIETRSKSQ